MDSKENAHFSLLLSSSILMQTFSLSLHERVPIVGLRFWSVPVFLSIHLLLQNSPLQRIPV